MVRKFATAVNNNQHCYMVVLKTDANYECIIALYKLINGTISLPECFLVFLTCTSSLSVAADNSGCHRYGLFTVRNRITSLQYLEVGWLSLLAAKLVGVHINRTRALLTPICYKFAARLPSTRRPNRFLYTEIALPFVTVVFMVLFIYHLF